MTPEEDRVVLLLSTSKKGGGIEEHFQILHGLIMYETWDER